MITYEIKPTFSGYIGYLNVSGTKVFAAIGEFIDVANALKQRHNELRAL